jgi:hypothetical protein
MVAVTGNISLTGSLIFDGGNNWMITTPPNTQSLFIENMKHGYWDWTKQIRFDANGDVVFGSKVCLQDMCLSKAEFQRIKDPLYLQKLEQQKMGPPPIDCEVTSWSVWSDCTKPCGGGTQARARTISRQFEKQYEKQ